MEYYSQYKGVWYKYLPESEYGCAVWRLSDTIDGTKNVNNYNANIYRIDQAFELWFRQMSISW